MKLHFLITGLIFAMFNGAISQEIMDQKTRYMEIFSTGYDGAQLAFHLRSEARYTDIKGSPFLNEQWSPGRIILEGDSIGAAFPMRFNMYGNEMQFINGSDTFSIANPLKVRAVYLNGHRFEYLPFNLGQNENMAWFEVILSGHVRLLLRHSARLERGVDPVTPYHCNNSVDRFVQGKVYYYQSADMAKPAEMPDNRIDFKSTPQLNKTGVKDFLRENRINLRREKDILELFIWINKQI